MPPASPDQLTDQARWGLIDAGAGAAAVVVVRGDRVRTVLHGQGQLGLPVSAATPFHICSCSKTFTAAAFARLVQEGVASWDDPVRDVVAEFLPPDAPFAATCTFRDLAAMRVGLGRAGVAEWGIRQDMTREARLLHGRHIGLVAPFRQRFSYSNLCYIALALAAERLAKQPYAELVRDLVCLPLGLSRTLSAGNDAPPDAATPQMPVMGRMVGLRDLTGANSEGSARIHMTAEDAALWLRGLLSALRGSGDCVWSAIAEDMARPWVSLPNADRRQAPEGDGRAAYGMGLAISRLRDAPLLRHGGGGRGWRHAMALLPEQDAGVMVMAAAETPAIEGLALELLESLAWGESRPWREVFVDAATSAAAAERDAIDARFTISPGRTASLRPGIYANAATGRVRIEKGAEGLRMMPESAPDLDADLRPVGPDVFELDFHEPALSRQPLDPPFRLRVATEGGATMLHTTYFGDLRAAA